jgi:deoxycytidine triphosphate deaminase
MVLSRKQILERIEAGQKHPDHYRSLSFSPSIEVGKSVDQCSIDLKVAPVFTTFKKPSYIDALDLRHAKDILRAEELWELHNIDSWELKPKQFVLAKTLESVHLPNDLMGLVEGRSSFARFGIGIHVTAPKIDPRYNDRITLELTNHSEAIWKISTGPDGISLSQLILIKLSPPLKGSELRGALKKDLNIEKGIRA